MPISIETYEGYLASHLYCKTAKITQTGYLWLYLIGLLSLIVRMEIVSTIRLRYKVTIVVIIKTSVMKILILVLIILGSLFTACQKITPNQELKDIKTRITNLKGEVVKEVAQSTVLRLSAPEFVELNKQGVLKKDGYIGFDDVLVKIQDAADDYIVSAVPIMNYIESRSLNIRLIIRQQFVAYLCRACVVYRPTVRGQIFAGFTAGVTDGTFLMPAEMTHDASGNIYIIDQRASVHDLIMKVTPAGVVSVFAGGRNEFGRLVGIGIDNSRNILYVSDATTQRVKAISLTGSPVISTLAGSWSAGNTDEIGRAHV